VHLVGLAVRHRPDRDAQKGQTFEKTGTVGLIAGQPVNVLGQDEIKKAVFGILHHALEFVAPMDAGAGNSAVSVRSGHRPVAARRVIATKGELIVDRAVLLQL
jgi:acyl dehydratase